jgi:hypothetical protein
LIVIVVAITGCSAESHHEGPTIVGARTNSNGEVTQQLIKDVNFKTRNVLITPEGPKKRMTDHQVKFFLKEGDNPARELALNGEDSKYCGQFWPVQNSTLWVGSGINPGSNENTGHAAVFDGKQMLSHNENDLHIIVFDEGGVISRRKLSVVPKWESSVEEVSFDSKNRMLVISSPRGLKKYDPVADSLSDLK